MIFRSVLVQEGFRSALGALPAGGPQSSPDSAGAGSIHAAVSCAASHALARRYAHSPPSSGRMEEVGLRLHPTKTRIVYCKDGRRRGSYEHTSFTFLGYAFRPRGARRADGTMFVGFQPTVSPEALGRMSQQVRRWRIHTRTRHDLGELAALINAVVAGWMNYYGRFYRSQLSPLLQQCDEKSGVNREAHAPFCGSRGCDPPGPPDQVSTVYQPARCAADRIGAVSSCYQQAPAVVLF
ncbi:hypothetical protein FMEAI12_7050023 [Parafrankia sp. Ea1.12]|nr:hypothetical protein FMEAI12_7050023 [Parafrankia sp. Ea1.12]